MRQLFTSILALVFIAGSTDLYAFCGFYVAKADAQLFNESSQVIMVRNGHKTTITMSNDFQGDVKDFAMVVPVPVVLEKSQIKTIEAELFTKLDQYSAPRVAKYYDPNPCRTRPMFRKRLMNYHTRYKARGVGGGIKKKAPTREEALGIDIKAKYTVGEYDIMILSAKHSNGLETYLIEKGYKIPEQAKEVLDPYVKSNMKFFVVKVNLEQAKASATTDLTPLQISFESEKFMLPIRLGMANAQNDQDMIVYCVTQGGRVETTNYRTVKIPTNKNVPLSVKDEFGKFYKAVFNKAHQHNQQGVFLEYAWDVSKSVPVKCDPCVGPPPLVADVQKMGVDWLDGQGYGDMFLTRLHVRYNRQNFPQDLMFQETANKQKFQGRYVIHIPHHNTNCVNGKNYKNKVYERRKGEINNLVTMTGWKGSNYQSYLNEFKNRPSPKRTTRKGATFGIMGTTFDQNNFTYLEMNYMKIALYTFLGIAILLFVINPSRKHSSN